ncbi:S1C family serine protease [bacterium]|nr:S1C family serine protease [bacterium]MCI0566507.1 S1C family serine protease [bacterium]MCI0680051.1 S1C family serine protease [bacterium]
MELEKLNKTQLILLALLVSFVTSIATGIVTVSLMDQAPPAVTQTVNRIVERVAPGNPEKVVEEKTIVVKEEGGLIDAVDLNARKVVLVVAEKDAPDDSASQRIFSGFILKKGIIATAGINIDPLASYFIVTDTGKKFSAEIEKNETPTPFAFLSIADPAFLKEAAEPVSFALPDSVKLGQSVAALWGVGADQAIESGIISKFMYAETEGEISGATETDAIIRILTSIPENGAWTGGPILDKSGKVIGMAFSGGGILYAIPGHLILKAYESVRETGAGG